MRLPAGTPGIVIATEQGRCNNCGNSIRLGDRTLNPFRGIRLCVECWPAEVTTRIERNRPQLCSSCNIYHPIGDDCW
jgi:hypothetical protein